MKDMAKGAATASAISIAGLTGSAIPAQAYQAEVRLVLDAYQEMFQ
jgi:hypothetical protein